jgi:hypothetical protein
LRSLSSRLLPSFSASVYPFATSICSPPCLSHILFRLLLGLCQRSSICCSLSPFRSTCLVPFSSMNEASHVPFDGSERLRRADIEETAWVSEQGRSSRLRDGGERNEIREREGCRGDRFSLVCAYIPFHEVSSSTSRLPRVRKHLGSSESPKRHHDRAGRESKRRAAEMKLLANTLPSSKPTHTLNQPHQPH